MNPLRTRALTRQQIGQFVDSERGIRAFEDAQADISAQYDAITNASFLTVSTEPSLGAERVLTPTGDFAVTDGGANSTYTIALSTTGVVAGVYGDASHTVSITVDSRGRISSAAAYALNTDNITEGATNLYFTVARARTSVAAGTGLNYNSASGVFSLANTTVSAGSYGSASQVATFTADAQGRLTAAGNVAISIGAAAVSGVALTRVDDTNVTLTLGGSPSTALVAATSLTLGWTGTLAVARGGTGGGAASGTLLDNISGFASTGHLVRTGAGSYSFRTVTGTANQIDVANGNGVGGNPTLSISATYAGQTSITTLGTIVTGAWQATTIGVSYGGTGLTSYTAGDMLYASGASTLSKLAIGTSNYVLTSSGSAPQWTANTGTGNVVRATQPQFTSTIGVGAAASSSGSGISFPATQSASTDPNTLDDYEEGTWTPTVTSTVGSITSYTVTAYYTKTGRKVDITVVIIVTNNGTGAGAINFTLPFTAATGPRWIGAGREDAMTGNMLQVRVGSGATIGEVLTYNNAYPAGTNYQLVCTASYHV